VKDSEGIKDLDCRFFGLSPENKKILIDHLEALVYKVKKQIPTSKDGVKPVMDHHVKQNLSRSSNI
jgi:hypothetical protein